MNLVGCFFCQKEAIYRRPYSGETVCKKCFLESIEKNIKQTISQYGMLRPDDRIAIAISGGKDSVSLLHILNKIEGRFPESEQIAITIDEGISGYRSEAIRIAKKNCRKLGIEHHVFSFKELFGLSLDEIITRAEKVSELSPCSHCGILRRKALNMAAKKVSATKLAIAHNLDDEVQSMLMNIIRGDISRISRVNPVLYGGEYGFVRRVKPLCRVPESEVALYAFFKGIQFQTIPCPYLESSVRQDVKLFLNRLELKHPGTKYTIYRSFEKIHSYLNREDVQMKLRYCRICGEPTAKEVCRACETLQYLN